MSKEEGRIVALYLKSLKSSDKRGKRTPELLRQDLAAVDKKLGSNPSPVLKLKLYQKQIDLKQKIRSADKTKSATSNKKDVEASFISIAKKYSGENNISNTAWRKVGVPGSVLIQAGLAKARK